MSETRPSIVAFVQRVRDAYDQVFPERKAESGYGCAFHLCLCHCGAPVWQQPCPICGYYPLYGASGTSWAPNSCTREHYVRVAESHGGVAAWYFARFRRTLAYKPWSDFARRIDALHADAQGWSGVPDAGDIWDAFHGDRPNADAATVIELASPAQIAKMRCAIS